MVIANGIDVDRFVEAKPFAARELPWATGPRVVGYVGRFDRVKNLPLLLRSFARIAGENAGKYRLALVGYGSEEAVLRRMAVTLGISELVHFPGATRVPERWYKSFTCHCLPSTAEGFGLTLVEAMAAGIPVVAIRTPVTVGIVRDTIDGLLIDRSDADLLADALQGVMNVSVASSSFPISSHLTPESSAQYVRQLFSMSRMVELYAKFFKNF